MAEQDNDNFDEAQAAEARAQAEARRQRILEKANQRMGVVSGEQAQGDGEKKSSASKAARIRAARQRRYKQKATPAAAAAPAEETTAAETTKAEPKEETKPDPPAAAATETAAAKEAVDTTGTGTDTAAPAGGKKKYMGVAKMRRKMIAKKKIEEEEEAKTAVDDADLAKFAAAKKVAIFPICMHILIVVLLFVAGLDVGIQQFHDDVVVHPKNAIEEYGLPFIKRNPFQPLASASTEKDAPKEVLLSSSDQVKALPKGVDQDEFAEVVVKGEAVPNIDPLFRVDLDELTKGPGIMNQMARGAVSIHRMILYVVYYTPISLFNTLLSIPVKLIEMPPALFLIAIGLRQLVGKVILGAHIPESKGDDSEEKNNIEVLSMAKNFVKNFFVTNFPTVVWAYDVFCHLRSDMYIVLCGVFLGMAWSHLVTPDAAPVGLEDAAPAGDLGDEL